MIKNRISLKDKIKIPHYSLSEELVNAVSHGIGALFSVAALVLTVVLSTWKGNVWGVVSSAIYGGTLIILYTMSTLYHSFKVNNAKRVFRIIDHCSIYLLIAGTYTPYTLVSLRGPVGWTLFGVVWGAAILGIIFSCEAFIWVDRFFGYFLAFARRSSLYCRRGFLCYRKETPFLSFDFSYFCAFRKPLPLFFNTFLRFIKFFEWREWL